MTSVPPEAVGAGTEPAGTRRRVWLDLVLAFPAALALWAMAAPWYSRLLRAGARATLPHLALTLDAVTRAPHPRSDLAGILDGVPLDQINLNAAACLALLGVAALRSPKRRFGLAATVVAVLAVTHLLAVLFTVDWAYVVATSQRTGSPLPAARVAVSALGYWLFDRVIPLAGPVVIATMTLAPDRAAPWWRGKDPAFPSLGA